MSIYISKKIQKNLNRQKILTTIKRNTFLKGENMKNTELSLDKVLKIRTTGRDDSHADQFHYPYEPTPYAVLERLANSGYIRKNNTLIDYGCGKGRVDFYLSWQTRCRTIGVEYDERIYKTAVENRQTVISAAKTEFVLEDARVYEVPVEADCFYFFNPFSVEILRGVLRRIEESYYERPREMLLFFYYPSEEYISCLMQEDNLEFVDEINCSDLFGGNDKRESILVFAKL